MLLRTWLKPKSSRWVRLQYARSNTAKILFLLRSVREREDGLWDIDAQMQDRKTYPFTLASCVRETAEALHSMILVHYSRTTLLTIVDVEVLHAGRAVFRPVPKNHTWLQTNDGQNVMCVFASQAWNVFRVSTSCTHITEWPTVYLLRWFRALA